MRPGTPNVAGIVGAAEALVRAFDPLRAETMRILRHRLWTGIERRIPNVLLNTSIEESVVNTLNVSFLGLAADALVFSLSRRGLAVSTGSACHAESRSASHVLTAMGRTPKEARAAIRLSLGRNTSAEDIDFALDVLEGSVAALRKTAPQEP